MKNDITGIFGVSDSGSAYRVSEIVKNKNGRSLVLTATEGRAKVLAEDLSFFVGKNVPYFPEDDNVFMAYETRDRGNLIKRLKALSALRDDENAIVVAPVSYAVKKSAPHELFSSRDIVLERGKTADLESIKASLTDLGYERLPLVEAGGTFSIRGDILDVFPPEMDDPVRIEFFDDEIETIRSFDKDTQRSKFDLKSVTVRPAEQLIADKELFGKAYARIKKDYDDQIKKLSRKKDHEEAVRNLMEKRDKLLEYVSERTNLQLLEGYIGYFYDEPEYLWDQIEGGRLIVEDPDRIFDYLGSREKEMEQDFETLLERGQLIPGDSGLIPRKEDFLKALSLNEVYVIAPFMKRIEGIESWTRTLDYETRPMTSFNGRMDMFGEELRTLSKGGYDLTIAAVNDERKKNLQEFISREDLIGRCSVRLGSLSGGFVSPKEKVAFISDSDIFGVAKQYRRRSAKSRSGEHIRDFSDLNKGDYVVHENRGIGKYLGVEKLKIDGEDRDYLKIKYAGTDMLYVPVERFDLVQKYIGSEGAAPKLNKLSGNEWKKTKRRAREAIAEMADELIDLYAKRKMEKGFAFDEDDVWQQEFEERFPFEETEDQLRCTREIKADMEKPEAMDRLLLGDVGFGKTEVAARAICKCVLNSKQAAVLVPTTLLASQHYATLKERFEGIPIRIEMMSRFRTDAELKAVARAVSEGAVDLVIGTHRLLSDDVKFKDLGLLVVDEEQRFGVSHKEKIKKLKKNVDVLTLSATPIPRTLNMSLSGIKDMSLISEPPEERYPVQTYVMEQSEQTIRESILRELDRGGQVFIIYNRVRGINIVAKRISEIVPEARTAIGHGQMNEHALEDVMIKFVNKEIDVLIATTIIESGIDIQNANTLIVLDSDRFGLAQLYQLRGRVGRSNRIAYAYFMYDRDKVLTEVAAKRLKAIREFTEFGSGFKVAMRDLELRGAGNLLGSEQSGHMMSIGYELYCKLVDEQVRKLKGEKVLEDHVETEIDLKVAAGIPSWYIEDDEVKLNMYKRISFIRTFDEESDIISELRDRFGEVPKETLNLVKVARIKGLSDELSMKKIYETVGNVVFAFDEKGSVTSEGLIKVSASYGNSVLVHGGNRPYLKLNVEKFRELDESIKLLELLKGDNENAV